MRLHSLQLKNIRSYTNANIDFPEGSVMLAGDIGTGKTTILLAVEFALFGLVKGTTNGNILLRHGAREGQVTLECTIQDKRMSITRGLKRSKTGVTQTNGYIIENGTREDLTPTELRARIIDLLGYPKELVTQGTSLVYRYTVYTPQEEMKQILSASKEERLDTLRKLFNIDKYKRTRENAQIYSKELKARKAVEAARAEGLHNMEQELFENQQELKNSEKEIKKLEEEKIILETGVKQSRAKLSELETHDETRRTIEKQLASIETEKIQLDAREQRAINELARTRELIARMPETKNAKFDPAALKNEEEKLERINEKQMKIIRTKAESALQKQMSMSLKDSISQLTICPMCKQEVNENHKHEILTTEDLKIRKAANVLDQIALLQKELNSRKEECQKRIAELKQIDREALQASTQAAQRSELESRIRNIENELQTIKKSSEETRAKILIAREKLEKLPSNKELIQKAREELESHQRTLSENNVKIARINERAESSKRTINQIEKEIIQKKEENNQIEQLTILRKK